MWLIFNVPVGLILERVMHYCCLFHCFTTAVLHLSCAGPIDPYVVKSLMWQLLNGLSYLHQNWVIHRDLKV